MTSSLIFRLCHLTLQMKSLISLVGAEGFEPPTLCL